MGKGGVVVAVENDDLVNSRRDKSYVTWVHPTE